jgi:hypothetical protein
MYMGNSVDGEPDGLPTPSANGDDNDSYDDEDGVLVPTAFISGVPVTYQVTTSGPGFLQGWVDWNADGDWATGRMAVSRSSRATGSPPPGFTW